VDTLIEPALEGADIYRAIAAAVAISLSGAPLGVFLVLRRMSLSGDVYTHTLLPGVAVAFLIAGESMTTMIVGGLASGLIVACLAGLVARYTVLREDAALASFYMISLSVGMVLLAGHTDAEELLHVLFGDVFAIDGVSLAVIGAVSSLTLFVLAMMWRALVIESYDPVFFASVNGIGTIMHMTFIILVILNLVIGATALGTVMAIGLMTVPGASARFWSRDLSVIVGLSIAIALTSSFAGILAAARFDLPAGPTIIFVSGGWFVVSILFGRCGGLILRLTKRPHLET